jgi:hypothetical protein
MPALSEYTNVYNTALVVLQQKGFQVWYDKKLDAYLAEKDGWDFLSQTPCGLLGVIAIFEHKRPSAYGEYWWKEDEPDLFQKLPERPLKDYIPVWKKK